MGIYWGSGSVEYRMLDGVSCVIYFANNGVVWYDAIAGVAVSGWEAELEPFDGPGAVGLPFYVAQRADFVGVCGDGVPSAVGNMDRPL